MARGASLISSPTAILSLLRVVGEVLQNETLTPGSDDLKKLLWSGVVLYNRLSAIETSSVFEIEVLQPIAQDIFAFLLDFLEALFDPSHSAIWKELRDSYPTRPPEIVEATAAVLRTLRLVDALMINVSLGSNFLASFSSFQNPPTFSGSQPMKIIETTSRRRASDVKAYTISILTADKSAETMDIFSLPKRYTWKDPEDDEKMKSATLNSPVLTSSVRPEAGSNSDSFYDYRISLIVPNEYKEGALSRRTDSIHWKAKLIEETGDGVMEYEVKCVFWDEASGNQWNSKPCFVLESNLTYTVCRCNVTGTFAVAMSYPIEDDSFWKVAGADSLETYKKVKFILNIAGNTISIASLVVLMLYLSRKNTIPELRDHTKVKVNLTLAYIGYHLCFIIFPLVESIEVGCKFVGAMEHFFTFASLGWLCVNNCYIFNALINGKLRMRMRMSFIIVWFLNALIVTIIACSTSASDYGTGLMCLPTGLSSYVTITEAGLFLLISIGACIVMLCNVDAPAYLNPRIVEALQ